jgi:hypothetical protein
MEKGGRVWQVKLQGCIRIIQDHWAAIDRNHGIHRSVCARLHRKQPEEPTLDAQSRNRA